MNKKNTLRAEQSREEQGRAEQYLSKRILNV